MRKLFLLFSLFLSLILASRVVAIYDNKNKVKLKKVPNSWVANILEEQPIYYDDAKISIDPSRNVLRLRPGEFRNFTVRIHSDKPTIVYVRPRSKGFIEAKQDKVELPNRDGSVTITALLVKSTYTDFVDFYIKDHLVHSCKISVENRYDARHSSSIQFRESSSRVTHSISSNYDTWGWTARIEVGHNSYYDTSNISGAVTINW